MIVKEEWKGIPKLESKYEVSNYGRVRSLDSRDVLDRLRRGRILKVSLDSRGYPKLCVSSTKEGLRCTSRVHRLVALLFVPNPKNKPQVNHKDGDKQNNHYSNLEWMTNKENVQHSYDIGIVIPKTGKEAPRYKAPTKVFDMKGNYLYTLHGNKEMKEKGFDYRLVHKVVVGERPHHKQHVFKRED